MNSIPWSCRLHCHPAGTVINTQGVNRLPLFSTKCISISRADIKVHLNSAICYRKPPKYLRYPRRDKIPPESGIYTLIRKGNEVKDPSELDVRLDSISGDLVDEVAANSESDGACAQDEQVDFWEAVEIEAISSLFQGRIPQKPGRLNRERPLPLPLPYKIRPQEFPTVKRHVRTASPAVCSRLPLSMQIYKDPGFLLNLAREIKRLPAERNVSTVLNQCSRFLRKGSLSLTIRELGHMGLPDRALQTFCWAQKQTHLFPDDRILVATVEILARTHELKLPLDLRKFASLASRGVLEAIVRGFIKGGNLNLAWKLISAARYNKRMLDSSIYAKLILELGKNPDRDNLVIALLEELGERDTLDLSLQDCTAIMKVCVRLQKFEFVECLFEWFQQSGNQPSLVLYTTVIHSRFLAKKYREGLALVWEMESLNFIFDLPAYCVVIKLFVALEDIRRAARYFSKMKEAGFSPTYDLYRDMISMYLLSGRLAKCKEVCKEVELAGFKLDAQLISQLMESEK